ncbi:Thiol-disulfide oxidoreductase ResA [compost metagenome]
MKKINLLALLCFVSFSILAQQKNIEIIGDIKNLPAKQVYLRALNRDKNRKITQPIIALAKVSNGKFILQKDTLLADPAWSAELSYKDSITNKIEIISFYNPDKSPDERGYLHGGFILENAKMQVNGDFKLKKAVLLSGSKETEYQMKTGLMFAPSLSLINKKIDSLQALGASDQMQSALAERDEIIKKYKAEFKQMVIENPSTWGAVLNIYQNAHSFSPQELEEFVAIFDKSVMSTATGKKLLNHIQQNKLLLPSMPFPAFSYTDVNNKKFTLNQLKGKKGTLIVFWASWCGPCRAEIPELKTFYANYKDKGIDLISISTDHSIVDWKKALDKEKMPWANLSNLPGDYKEIISKYNVTAIPAMFLLDKDNKIVLADPNDFKLIQKHTNQILQGI